MDETTTPRFDIRDSITPDCLIKAFFVVWSLGALAAVVHVAERHPPEDWLPVLIPSVLAVGVLIAPVSNRVRIGAALLVGLIVRTWAGWLVAAYPLTQYSDPSAYDLLSSSVLAGRGLIVWDSGYGLLQAAYPPLYPILLAAAKLVGLGWIGANLLCEVAATAMIWRLAGDRAAAAYFLFPSVVVAALIPTKEPLATALLLGCMLLWKHNWVAYGAVAGLLALTQPAWIPVPIVAFFLARPRPMDVLKAAGAGTIILCPWWVRNYLLFHQFIPLTTTAGFTLGVVLTGHYGPYAQLRYDEPARAWYAFTHSVSGVAHQPLRYLGNVIMQALRAFLFDDTAPDYIDERFSWVGTAAVVSQLAWAAAIAACARASPRDRRLWSFVAGFLVTCFVAGGIWLEFGTRHRAFAVPLLLMWSGLASRGSKRLFSAKRRSRTPHPANAAIQPKADITPQTAASTASPTSGLVARS
jgi:hypothetical protein